jgi:hypothetical protein
MQECHEQSKVLVAVVRDVLQRANATGSLHLLANMAEGPLEEHQAAKTTVTSGGIMGHQEVVMNQHLVQPTRVVENVVREHDLTTGFRAGGGARKGHRTM